MLRPLVLIIVLLTLPGCGWVNSFFIGKDNSLPAAELQALTQTIALETLWRKRVTSGEGDEFVKLVPALSNAGQIFVAGHDGEVVALDSGSGNLLWRHDSDLEISAGVGFGDGLVLLGNSDGDVLALNAATGAEAWTASVSSEVLAPPQSAQGVVVVRTIDGAFSGLDARSGARIWNFNYTVPALSLRGTSAPLLAQGTVLTGLDNGRLLLLGLADGGPVGGKTISPPRGRTEMDRLVDIDADLHLLDNTVYVAAYQGAVSAIDLLSGNTLWRRPISSYSGLGLDQGRVYVSDFEGSVWALERENGGTLWKQTELAGRRLSAPAIVGSYVTVGDFEGYVHWLDRDSGRIVARIKVDDQGISAAPLAAGGVLFVLGKGGYLSALRAAN